LGQNQQQGVPVFQGDTECEQTGHGRMHCWPATSRPVVVEREYKTRKVSVAPPKHWAECWVGGTRKFNNDCPPQKKKKPAPATS
jgi:hypothetical protein